MNAAVPYCSHETRLNFIYRFDGVAPEPRQGVRSGHIPGTKCVPFHEVGTVQCVVYHIILGRPQIAKKLTLLVSSQMFDGAPMLLPADELSKKFEEAGVNSVSSHCSNPETFSMAFVMQERK